MHLQSGTPLWFILLLIEKDKEPYHVLSGMVLQRHGVRSVESSSESGCISDGHLWQSSITVIHYSLPMICLNAFQNQRISQDNK